MTVEQFETALAARRDRWTSKALGWMSKDKRTAPATPRVCSRTNLISKQFWLSEAFCPDVRQDSKSTSKMGPSWPQSLFSSNTTQSQSYLVLICVQTLVGGCRSISPIESQDRRLIIQNAAPPLIAQLGRPHGNALKFVKGLAKKR